jgi:hypothetical protein
MVETSNSSSSADVPPGLAEGGRRLWLSLLSQDGTLTEELNPARQMALEACRTKDRLDVLDEVCRAEPVMLDNGRGHGGPWTGTSSRRWGSSSWTGWSSTRATGRGTCRVSRWSWTGSGSVPGARVPAGPGDGARVFDEAVLSRPKGRAKSELAGLIGVAEAFGPVRFDGWDADGQPVGRPVTSARC